MVKKEKPNPKPDPNPTPVPEGACIDVFGPGGFTSQPVKHACDSVPQFDRHFFYGVKMPKDVRIMVFPWDDCAGDWAQPVERTTEYIQRDGVFAFPASLAFIKQAKAGCVNFYTGVCHAGKPAFMICDDIKDTQLVNFSQLPQVQSILPDNLSIGRVSFFTEANFQGEAVVIDGRARYNIGYDYEVRRLFRSGRVRSVKIHKD